MPISPDLIASYAPWGNAQLAFRVRDYSTTSIDPATGNPVQSEVTLEYLAALNVERPNWSGAPGSDQTAYTVNGRVLSPPTLDPRITNGSQAYAVINGAVGRLELTFDLAMDAFHKRDLRQTLQGTFRLVGGPTSDG